MHCMNPLMTSSFCVCDSTMWCNNINPIIFCNLTSSLCLWIRFNLLDCWELQSGDICSMASYPNCSSDWTLVSVTALGKLLLCVSSSLNKRERESVWEVQAQTHCPVRYLVPNQLQGASRWGGEGANLSRILGELSSSSCIPCRLHLALKPGWIVGLENVYHAVYRSSAELTCMFAPSHKTKSLPLKEDEAAEPEVAPALHQPEAPVLLQLSWAGTCVGQSVSEKWVKFFCDWAGGSLSAFWGLRREEKTQRWGFMRYSSKYTHSMKVKKKKRETLWCHCSLREQSPELIRMLIHGSDLPWITTRHFLVFGASEF